MLVCLLTALQVVKQLYGCGLGCIKSRKLAVMWFGCCVIQSWFITHNVWYCSLIIYQLCDSANCCIDGIHVGLSCVTWKDLLLYPTQAVVCQFGKQLLGLDKEADQAVISFGCCFKFDNLWYQYKKLGKIFTGRTYKLLLKFTVISEVYRSLFQVKLHLPSNSYSLNFKAPRELENPPIKGVLGKFHGSGGHNKHKCLQNWSNFTGLGHVLIFNTVVLSQLGWGLLKLSSLISLLREILI